MRNVYFFLALFFLSCSQKEQKKSIEIVIKDTLKVNEETVNKNISEEIEPVPDIYSIKETFEDFISIKWNVIVNGQYNSNNPLVLDSLIIYDRTAKYSEIVYLKSGETLSLKNPVHQKKIKELLTDSIFLIRNDSRRNQIFNIYSNEILFECKFSIYHNQTPKPVRDSIIIMQTDDNIISKFNIYNPDRKYWTYEFDKSDYIRQFHRIDTIVLIESKYNIYALGEKTGILLWTIKSTPRKSNLKYLQTDSSILIDDIRSNSIVKRNVYNGDTIKYWTFSEDINSIIREHNEIYFTVRDTGLYKINLLNDSLEFVYTEVDSCYWGGERVRCRWFGEVFSDSNYLYLGFNSTIGKFEKINMNKIWKIEQSYEIGLSPHSLILDSFIISEVGWGETNKPVLIDIKTGEPIAFNEYNYSKDEDGNFLTSINVNVNRCQNLGNNYFLQVHSINNKRTFTLMEIKY